jgi:ABC-type uncharacterized transport system ATPase subunit
MKDESHLPVSEQSLVFRLRKRAEIRRNIKDRKSVQEGTPDRIADLLEEAADQLTAMQKLRHELEGVVIDCAESGYDEVCETTLKHVISKLSTS